MILLACYTLILISMVTVYALSKDGLKGYERVFCFIAYLPIAIFAGLYLVNALILT